ncbi:MAG: hypothetical protein ACYTDT_01200 [Planctomycetota bacterium]|jgi:hypothetical protein
MTEKNENRPEEKSERASSKPTPLALIAVLGGIVVGTVFSLAMPSTWLFVPQDEAVSSHDHAHSDGGGKEFWA